MLNPNTALLTVKHFTMYTEAKEVQRILPYYLASVHTGALWMDVLHRTVVEQIKQSVPRSLQAASAEPRSGDPSFKIKEMLFISLTFVKSQNHPSFQTICLILVKNKSEHYIHNYHHHRHHPLISFNILIIIMIFLILIIIMLLE